MTAFDNIKTNNWPAASNEFEDFLVLKLPLNDNASLTESLPVVAGSQELFPKRTLTNAGVSSVQPRSVVNVKLHTYINNTPSTLTVNGNTVPRGSDPNGDVTFTVAVNGALSSIAWSYDSGNGPYCYMKGIEVDLGDGNGYQLIQDGAFGVSAYSSLISGTVDSNYPLSNLFGGTIGTGYTNGTRHVNPGTLTLDLSSVFPPKKHYDNNATLNSSSSNYIQTSGLDTPDSNDYTYECYAKADGTISSYSLFHTNPTGRAGILFLFGSSTAGQLYFGNGSSWSNYVDLTWSIDSDWHHYAIVRQGGGNVNLYIDGQLNTSFAAGAHTHGELVLGRQSGDNNLYWNGAIQDVRVYKTAKYTSNFTPPSAILG